MIDDIEELKGVKIPSEVSNHEELSCDICNKKISKSKSKIGVYTSDVNLREKTRTDMKVDVIFCHECNPKKIRYPHLGINEIHFTVFIEPYNESLLVERAETNQISTKDEGSVWTPLKLWNRVTDNNYEPNSPSYISEKLLYQNIYLDDVIEPYGKHDINYIMKETYNENIN